MTGPETAVTLGEWFTAMVQSLPLDIRSHYDEVWRQVQQVGLEWEVQRTTHLLFSAREEWVEEAFEASNPPDQAVFWFALKEAVYDWDIISPDASELDASL